jgi:hypothetical protein
MTLKRFFGFLPLQWIFFAVLKIVFFKYLNWDNSGAQYLTYWVLIIIVAVALARRLGVINYLEAILASAVWFGFDVFFDLLFTSGFIGLGIFSKWQYWVGNLVMSLAVFLFHKKRHVEIRKEMAKLHHGHH